MTHPMHDNEFIQEAVEYLVEEEENTQDVRDMLFCMCEELTMGEPETNFEGLLGACYAHLERVALQ